MSLRGRGRSKTKVLTPFFLLGWVLPMIFKRIVAFQKTLVMEPPIRLGTPDPYVPKRK